MAATVAKQVAVEKIGPGQFRSKALPAMMGNALAISYGGFVLGVGSSAAYCTVPDTHAIYSMVGHFLGPTSLKEGVLCSVHETRNTKSFCTRRVEVKQHQKDGSLRVCAEMLVDFHVHEQSAPIVVYSAPPIRPYAGPLEQMERFMPVLPDGSIDFKAVDAVEDMFSLNVRFFETRYCREGVSAQNLNGYLKKRPTTQDALPLTSRTTAEWQRSKHALTTRCDRAAALAFMMDGGLSFLPLAHNHMWLGDAAASSTLDFALRFMTPDIDLNRWHLRERSTLSGGSGRSYSEGRLWDENGTLVASMTQQSILRLRPAGEKTSSQL